MERFWAPWRLQYYKEKDKQCQNACVFCLEESAAQDRARYVLHRGPDAFVMLNKYPFVGGHLLIIPYRHMNDITELSAAEAADIHRLTVLSCRVLREKFHPTGFNIGVNVGVDGGAGICDHLHQHLVPRWRGDTNFMPLLAEVRVLPQHLEETYDLLKPLFDAVAL